MDNIGSTTGAGGFGGADGSFESAGGGSSGIPPNSGGSSFDLPQGAQPDVNVPKMTWLGYLKDGVDKGYYKVEEKGIFSVEDVISQAQTEMEKEESPDQKIMNIPGTAHDKLSGLADMENEAMDRKGEVPEDYPRDELSFEQKIIKLQSEALKFLAKGIGEKGNDKEKEALLKKLEILLEELEENKDGKNASFIGAILGVMFMLFNATEKGTKQLEKELKRAQ